MRKKHRYILVIFLLLVNLAVFFFRDHFIYHKYSDYNELYGGDVTRWSDLHENYSHAELAKADSILEIATDIHNLQGTAEKAVRIGRFLRDELNHETTGKKINAGSCTPLILFDSVKKNNIDIDCGHYSKLFPFFCYSQGITTRYIQLPHTEKGHVFNEVYIPELRKWMVVDLVHNLLSAKDSTTYLDLWEFRNALRKNDRLTIESAGDKGIITQKIHGETDFVKNYYRDSFTYQYFHYTDLDRAYRPAEKLKRYFFRDYWFENFGESRMVNLPYYFKIGMFILLIGAIVYNLWPNDRS